MFGMVKPREITFGPLTINLNVTGTGSDGNDLKQVLALLNQILAKETLIMATQADLQAAIDAADAKVTADTDVVNSAVTLLRALTQMVKDAIASGGDPSAAIAAVQAVVAKIEANTSSLAAGVAENTPAAPTP